VRHGYELDVERSDHSPFAIAHDNEFGAVDQAGFFDSTSREAEGHSGSENGETEVSEQILQTTDVVLVTMSRNAADDSICVLTKPGEVGKYEIDPVHVGIGEHQSTIDQEQFAVLFDDHAVSADLAETSQEGESYRRCVTARSFGSGRH
jgi:hypothetical protein